MIKILAIVAILLGALIALSNLFSAWISRKTGRNVPPVPLVGGILLTLGLLGFSETRPYAWLGLIADYGTLGLILAIPFLVRDAWSTSSINLAHQFVSFSSGRRESICLFKNGIFTIELEHDPPVQSDDYGALALSQGLTGTWREEGTGFLLEAYAEDRLLRILDDGGTYRTREENYPEDQKFPIDRLDALYLVKVK